jgi:hypothetical protein
VKKNKSNSGLIYRVSVIFSSLKNTSVFHRDMLMYMSRASEKGSVSTRRL